LGPNIEHSSTCLASKTPVFGSLSPQPYISGAIKMQVFDLEADGLRALNSTLHAQSEATNQTAWQVINPRGSHAIACGLNAPIEVTVKGSTGYYCAGMNQLATVNVHGSAGPGVAENMMSGTVVIEGDASQYAGATGHGGLLVIKGNASSRCGISMKGIDIVVHGNIGHMSAFMAQSGNLVVCGDAGEALGDSLYEARLFVRGAVKSLGADCIEKEMRAEHITILTDLLERAGSDAKPADFKRYGSARQLYNFDVDNAAAY
jgi:glutamate synthase domain-containing protein 3